MTMAMAVSMMVVQASEGVPNEACKEERYRRAPHCRKRKFDRQYLRVDQVADN
jgi:hypothetical protein